MRSLERLAGSRSAQARRTRDEESNYVGFISIVCLSWPRLVLHDPLVPTLLAAECRGQVNVTGH